MSIKNVAGAAATAPATELESGCQSSFPTPIVSKLPADVKMLEEFQARHIPYDDIVATMRTAFPGFDKSLLSKCRNHAQYGVGLRPPAVKLLQEHFRIMEPVDAPRKPARKKPRRIQCRLTDAVYDLLQRRLTQTGQNAQDYLEAVILADLQAHAKELRT